MIIRKLTSIISILLSLLISSCSLMFSPLKVISWSPGSDTIADPNTVRISVVFSQKPDIILTGEAFSISNRNVEVPGRISWDGGTLIFTPYSKLPVNSEYTIRIDTSAEAPGGMSLREEFITSFRTGRRDERPALTSVTPVDETYINNRYEDIVLFFDKAMDFNSLLSEFSVTPDVRGISVLDSTGKVFTFSPVEPLELQQKYRVTLSAETLSSNGYKISDEYKFSFTISDDSTKPEILAATSEDYLIELTDNEVTPGWEKDTAIRLRFTEEVELDSVDSSVIIEPAAEFEISVDNTKVPSDIIISFTENLEWQVLYNVIISTALKDTAGNNLNRKAEYKLFIDGSSSAPPVLSRADFIPDGSAVCFFDSEVPGEAVESHRILDTSSGDTVLNPCYFDFYFTLADGAILPFFEFSQNFSINPLNECITLNYLNFQLFNPGESRSTAAAPEPTPSENQAVLRLITELTDSQTLSDMISFRVYSDLTDSLGNSMQKDWCMELFDEDN